MRAMGREPSDGQKTVLVVDDSQELQELVRELLQLEGFRVLARRSADDLLAAIEEDRPDVLIIDVFAPGRPAWDAYDLVKADPAPPPSRLSSAPRPSPRSSAARRL